MESFDLYDINRNKTGKTLERGNKVPAGYYRLVVHACIFGSDGRMLIQRRQPFKSGWAGMWDITAGGSAQSGDTSNEAASRELSEEVGIDVDLTSLSSTMVYSEVYNMMTIPEDYIGKVIKMEGAYSYYSDTSSGLEYHACIIQDATACCAQGVEFVPLNPEACPAEGGDVTVVGVFDTYMEGDYMYCTLRDAEIL